MSEPNPNMAMTAWSYSRWDMWDTCPKQAFFKFVAKIPEEENDAMRGGTIAHNEIAEFIRGDRDDALETIRGWRFFGSLFMELRELKALVEQEWSFRRNWSATGWFSGDTWLRSKMDAFIVYADGTADVVDHKTGKSKPRHALQAELYALTVFKRYSHVHHVTVRFWYLDSGEEGVHRYSRSGDMAELEAKWTKRGEQMLADKRMAPRPGSHCHWCSYAFSKGGPCKYG
ncbi:MAG TPA: PD-(D/E)XK nuclease family protein [Gammaproteobacteria bacterium]|nr:PD-(D/E)XK nuclease family protein [Gammaproteobacteria bacterium]